jgi:hypothetical protein
MYFVAVVPLVELSCTRFSIPLLLGGEFVPILFTQIVIRRLPPRFMLFLLVNYRL